MGNIAREVERNDQEWARAAGPNVTVQRSFPTESGTHPLNPTEFLGPTGGAEPRPKTERG